jgi:hypothetical protein
MAEDDRRVDGPRLLIGRSLGPSPEDIDNLQRRARDLEKSQKAPPKEAFAKVLRRGHSGQDTEKKEENENEMEAEAIPKKGPRPSLLHPSQRSSFGRSPDSDEPIVLKG